MSTIEKTIVVDVPIRTADDRWTPVRHLIERRVAMTTNPEIPDPVIVPGTSRPIPAPNPESDPSVEPGGEPD